MDLGPPSLWSLLCQPNKRSGSGCEADGHSHALQQVQASLLVVTDALGSLWEAGSLSVACLLGACNFLLSDMPLSVTACFGAGLTP